jgi:tetratricopeptide (TPR) repeat protein
MKSGWGLLAAVCALVIGLYAFMAQSGPVELMTSNAADTYYNLLVQGFRAGQLSLKKEVPPGLTKLADPYDPAANILYSGRPYRLLDLSYYKERLYLYFGVTPALILFWPFAVLTGRYLFHAQAVAIFCMIGFLVGAGLVRALWRRYFDEVNVVVVAACVLALGLTTGVPVLLSRSDVYEVPISCGYMLTMLALAAIWCALHEPERGTRWLVAASVVYGLAVGARPSLLFGAVIMLVPVMQAWPERRRVWNLLMAAVVPITLIGLWLMLYNARRFNDPFEFGLRYQLAGEREMARQLFSLRYLWFNFRIYFLEPAHWSAHSPFVHSPVPPLPPAGFGQIRNPFGVLTNIPLVWLALAAPLAWRSQSAQASIILRWFLAAVVMLCAVCALTVCFFFSASFRYEVDFLPALVLLAVVGILGLERSLANQPTRRRAVRCGWGLLLGFSVMFNLLASVEYYAEAQAGLGNKLFLDGKMSEAGGYFQKALRIDPNYGGAHESLGNVFVFFGRWPEAKAEYEEALRINPDDAAAHCGLGIVLLQTGRVPDAIAQLEHSLRIKPEDPEAIDYLGIALSSTGRLPEAVAQFEHALRITPDDAEVHYNLANALVQQGKVVEAITHYERTLQLRPDDVEAHDNLAFALAQTGRLPEAIAHFEQALRIKPDSVMSHYNLGLALEQTGRIEEAASHWEQALRINPNYAAARNKLAQVRAIQ